MCLSIELIHCIVGMINTSSVLNQVSFYFTLCNIAAFWVVMHSQRKCKSLSTYDFFIFWTHASLASGDFLYSVWLHCIVGSLLWTHTISLLYWYVVVNAGIDCYICDTTAIDNEDRQVCDDTFTLSRGATVESGCAACTKEKTIASGVMFSKYDCCALWYYTNYLSKH